MPFGRLFQSLLWVLIVDEAADGVWGGFVNEPAARLLEEPFPEKLGTASRDVFVVDMVRVNPETARQNGDGVTDADVVSASEAAG